MDALQRHPELFNGPVFTWLAQISDEASLSPEDRIKYDAALKAYRDTYAVMEGQYEEGMKKGMEKGMEKGRTEGLLYAALQMRNLGHNDEEIIKALGLDANDLKSL